MTDKTTVKVGDVVAWDEVPANWLFKATMCEELWFGLRYGDFGIWVGSFSDQWISPLKTESHWGWGARPSTMDGECTLVHTSHRSLLLLSAAEIRRLASNFDKEHPAT